MSDAFMKDVDEYITRLNSEKESLVAKYLAETGLKPSDIVLVERRVAGDIRFYPERKDKFERGDE